MSHHIATLASEAKQAVIATSAMHLEATKVQAAKDKHQSDVTAAAIRFSSMTDDQKQATLNAEHAQRTADSQRKIKTYWSESLTNWSNWRCSPITHRSHRINLQTRLHGDLPEHAPTMHDLDLLRVFQEPRCGQDDQFALIHDFMSRFGRAQQQSKH
jgi:hypothetical protein